MDEPPKHVGRYLLVSVLSLILARYSPFGSQCVYEVGLISEIR